MNKTASIVALVVVVTVGFFGVITDSNTSPGPISAVHAKIEALQGRGGCAACHGTKQHPLADACGDCHGFINDQLTNILGFHGKLPVDIRKDCGHCHVEHLGSEVPIVGDRAFKKGGWERRADYAHEGLAFELAGTHLALACSDCHKAADTEVLEPGMRRFAKLRQDCKSCHEDPHEGMEPDCNACHGQAAPFEVVARFEHDQRFPLLGGHARLACGECHSDGDKSGFFTADLAGQAKGLVRLCSACHESPHHDEFLHRVTNASNKTLEQSCALCHDPLDESLSDPDTAKILPFHDLTGFKLLEPHAARRQLDLPIDAN